MSAKLELLQAVKTKMLKRGSQGADLSPGDPDCWDAYMLLTEYEAILKVEKAHGSETVGEAVSMINGKDES